VVMGFLHQRYCLSDLRVFGISLHPTGRWEAFTDKGTIRLSGNVDNH
jgi:hypothetical protein